MTAIPKLIGKLVCMHSTCDNKQHEFSMWNVEFCKIQ